MIFTSVNFIIFFILLGINLAFVLTSKRKRRFGIVPSRIFQLLFVGYWLYLLVFLQVYNTPEEMVKKTKGKPKYDFAAELKKRKEKETFAHYHIEVLNYMIKAAGIQAMIALGLSILGLITVNNRNEYYYRSILIHAGAWAFCIYVDVSNLAI